MTFNKTITKEEIARMPMEEFSGKIVVVYTKERLKEALTYLSTCSEVGFDTETRPSFVKNSPHKMSLMQLSGKDTCYLIRLNKFKNFPKILETFLKNKQVKKIGLSLRDDFNKLHCLTKIAPDNFVDLQQYVRQFGIEEMSLQKIYAIVFERKISKSKQLSNWDAEYLTLPQMRYAALDAWSCLQIYQFLESSK